MATQKLDTSYPGIQKEVKKPATIPPKKKGGMTSGNSAKSGINSYLKKGGKVTAKPSSKMMYGGMKKGGTKKGM